jgi:hypothetical protein
MVEFLISNQSAGVRFPISAPILISARIAQLVGGDSFRNCIVRVRIPFFVPFFNNIINVFRLRGIKNEKNVWVNARK